MFSPKLIAFLLDHPAASRTLSNAVAHAKSGRAIEIYYFYTSSGTSPRSHHNYVGDQSVVGLFVRENQTACDECVSMQYELLNLRGEREFLSLFEAAKLGKITKDDFVTKILQKEFEAVKSTQELITKWQLDPKTAAESQAYQYFANAPKSFGGFLSYSNTNSQGLDRRAYEKTYDNLRKK